MLQTRYRILATSRRRIRVAWVVLLVIALLVGFVNLAGAPVMGGPLLRSPCLLPRHRFVTYLIASCSCHDKSGGCQEHTSVFRAASASVVACTSLVRALALQLCDTSGCGSASKPARFIRRSDGCIAASCGRIHLHNIPSDHFGSTAPRVRSTRSHADLHEDRIGGSADAVCATRHLAQH